jgi:hypothetical protein
MATHRWKHRPEGSNWGDFGPDDNLGRLNWVTPEKVKQGIAEVHEGRTFNLSLPLDYPGGNLLNARRHPPKLRPTIGTNGRAFYHYPFKVDFSTRDVICDDAVLLYLQYSTQWDSFAHVGALFDADGDGEPEICYYNGHKPGVDFVEPDPNAVGVVSQGAQHLGLHHMAAHGVQGRGVMVDFRAHFGDFPRVRVGYDALMRVLDADRVVIEKGDMVCFHTGFAEVVLGMQRQPTAEKLQSACSVLDGRDPKVLNWVTDCNASVLIADNYAVEEVDASMRGDAADPCARAFLPLHNHCLFKLGMHLGEIWHLTPLANWLRENKRSRFLLTAPPLRLPGAVGAPPCPVATV